ncbi:MAG: hypothetical protein ABJB01_13460 [Rudaea sp.]
MKKIILIASALCFFASLDALAVQAGTVPKAEMKKSARPTAQETERTISYEELGNFKGQRVIIHSATGTTRAGKLTKYSQTQIDIALDGSEAQFTFLRDAIKSIGVPLAPQETQGDGSAKKN